MSKSSVAGIILAAGKGTRMKSDLPKVLHEVCGETMVGLAARALHDAGVEKIVIVIGHGAELVRERMGEGYDYAVQDPPQGTGDAARVGLEMLKDWEGPILITAGDTPILNGEVLRQLVDRQFDTESDCVIATIELEDPTGYGRILWENGEFSGIVEEKDATPEQKKLKETCVSVYSFSGPALADAVARLTPANAQGEYYLTDAPLLISQAGGKVITEKFADPELFMGCNDRVHLSDAERILRRRINLRHMRNGVTMQNPDATYIGLDVEIGSDTYILANTHIEGRTKIGRNAEIGPNSLVRNSVVGDGAHVHFSSVKDSVIGEGCKVGPYATLRAQAHLSAGVKIGNYVEVKNSHIGEKASAAHLTYLGDATIGAKTNIGAGTITANYDGFNKHRTSIGTGAFIGTNSTLVAPVEIGDGAFVVAGSVITQNVPDNAGAFGRARQEVKEEWASRWRTRKQDTKS